MKIVILLFITLLYLYGFKLSDIKTYQANFIQTITNPQNKILKYKGNIYIKYPSSILWNYKEPIEKDIYIKQSIVTIIEPDLEQAIITNLEKNINIFDIFKNAKLISPNNYKALFNDTDYYINVKNNQIKSISYKDKLDNHIKIVFSKILQNRSISNNIFEFIIPLEYDTIRK